MYIIIDGSSMLTTNYFGTLPREMLFARSQGEKENLYDKIMQNSKGKFTNGVYTSLKQIFKIIQHQQPEGLIVVLDRSRDTFRREIFSEYKAQRPDTPKPLKEQFITFAEVLTEIGIPVFSAPEYEADDLAGSIVKVLESQGKECVLISGDKDYYQLVSPQTSLWRIATSAIQKKYEKLCGIDFTTYYDTHNVPVGFFEIKYGDKILIEDAYVNITPSQFVDYLAVAGDKADNIPGVHGVGTMTIIPLLQKYGSLDSIYQAINSAANTKELAANWKTECGIKTSPINAFVKNKDNAYLSQLLAKIKTDIAEIPQNANAYNLNINRIGFNNVIREYEFVSLKNAI